MKEVMTTVGVRLPPAQRKRLDEEADKRGVCRSVCLRQLAEEGLNDENPRLILEELREVKEELREVRQLVLQLNRNLKISLVAILVDGGKANPEDAEAFILERLA